MENTHQEPISADTLINSWKQAVSIMAGKWVYFAMFILATGAFDALLAYHFLGGLDLENPEDSELFSAQSRELYSALGGFLLVALIPYYFFHLLCLNLAIEVRTEKGLSVSNIFKNTFSKFWNFFKVCLVKDLLVMIGVLALIIPGIYLNLRFYLVELSVFFKDKNLEESLSESSKLVYGSKLMIFLIFIVVPAVANQITKLVLPTQTDFSAAFEPVFLLSMLVGYFLFYSIRIAAMVLYVDVAKPAE